MCVASMSHAQIADIVKGIDYLPAPAGGVTLAGAWLARLRRSAFAERRRERARLSVWESEGGALFAARLGAHPADCHYER